MWTHIWTTFSPFIQWEGWTDTFISVICGIIGAETRIGLDQVRFTKDPLFHAMSKEQQKTIPYRHKRWLIGSVSAFVGVVSFGSFLPVLHGLVIALISSLGGNSFLTSRVENGETGEHYYFLKSMAGKSSDSVEKEFLELAKMFREVSGANPEEFSTEQVAPTSPTKSET